VETVIAEAEATAQDATAATTVNFWQACASSLDVMVQRELHYGSLS
jgi:hypothetical protein